MKIHLGCAGSRRVRIAAVEASDSAPRASGLAALRQRWLEGLQRLSHKDAPAWLRRAIGALQGAADPAEPLLLSLDLHRGAIDVHFPAPAGERRARRYLRWLLRQRLAAHQKGVMMNAALLPVTAVLTVVPGPNVFLLWNAYRLLIHAQCARGARRVLLEPARLRFTPIDEELCKLCSTSGLAHGP